MIAALLGGTGLVGHETLLRLVGDPHYELIFVVGRAAPRISHPKIQFERLELSELDKSEGLKKADHVFCCLGSTIKKAGTQEDFRKVDLDAPLLAARTALAGGNLKKFLVVTSMGASDRSKIFYSRTKGELERSLCTLAIPELHIFRPALLIGNRAEFRAGEKVAQKVGEAFSFLFQGALRKYRPIDARVVAHSMIRTALLKDERGQHIHESDAIEQAIK